MDLNATQAAIRSGYSDKRASEIGYQLLRKTTVHEEIQAAMQERGKRTEITQDKVLDELAAVAFKHADDCSDSTLKYSNKLKALELLGKHLGMFTDRVEHTGEAALRVELSTEAKEMAE